MLNLEEKKKHVQREIPRFIKKINDEIVTVNDNSSVTIMLVHLMDHLACKGKVLMQLKREKEISDEEIQLVLITDIANHARVMYLFCVQKKLTELSEREEMKLRELKAYLGIRVTTLLQEVM